MDYVQTLAYLYSRLPAFHRVGEAAYKANLDNTLAFCKYLGNPETKFKSIHIAGTNGKGSTSHMMAAVLQSAGYRTGLYTSPHLKSFTERFRINGKEIPESEVVDFVETHKTFIENLQPSFFEMTVGLAFDWFARQKVDVAVIETGLGGRLDSTNVILPELSIITNISYDHQKLLGDSLPQIASEKAGIIKAGVPVVISEKQPETASVFLEKATQMNARIAWAEEKFTAFPVGFSNGKRVVNIRKSKETTEVELDLLGDYQLKNVAGVMQAVEILREQGWQILEKAVREGLANTVRLTGLKGRWQILQQNPALICDTGHNEAGISQIISQLEHTVHQKLFWIIGTVNDKDLSWILALLPKEAYYFFTQPHLPRALPKEMLFEAAQTFGLQGEMSENVNLALTKARQIAHSEDLILVAGSNFIVAEVAEL
jgi:dihydrofolate synthase / folylpolyglutamate synthase